MMGQAVGQQDRLFYEFNLDERIPVNYLLRRIDAVLDLSWLRAELSPFYSHAEAARTVFRLGTLFGRRQYQGTSCAKPLRLVGQRVDAPGAEQHSGGIGLEHKFMHGVPSSLSCPNGRGWCVH